MANRQMVASVANCLFTEDLLLRPDAAWAGEMTVSRATASWRGCGESRLYNKGTAKFVSAEFMSFSLSDAFPHCGGPLLTFDHFKSGPFQRDFVNYACPARKIVTN
jgi:hypothetical protein